MAAPGTGGIGDSNLTQTTVFPGGGAPNRVSQFFFDWRNRQVAGKLGDETGTESATVNRPIFYTELDNLSQVIASEQYDGDDISFVDTTPADGVPDKPAVANRRARSTNSFDERGRVFRTEVYSVNQTDGTLSSGTLKSDVWFDHRGQALKMTQPGGPVSKHKYDGAGRMIVSYLTDGGADAGWSDADDVTGDAVLSQFETQYDKDGNPILSTNRERFHDETATGPLADPATAPKARVSYVAQYFDKADRLTHTVDVGTFNGSPYSRPTDPPTGSTDTMLVTQTAYNAAGWVEFVTDARGIVHKTVYDNLGRTTRTIEARTPDELPTTNTNKTTDYTFDGSGHVLTVKATVLPAVFQTTQFVYGVTAPGSGITSNDVLAETRFPDKTTGDPSLSDKEVYTVNALGEQKTRRDRAGNVHTYSFDVVGRPTVDAVTFLASGFNPSVRRLETAYDTGGRPHLFTSWDADSAGTVVNQVQQAYNGLGQLITEYQSHSGPVDTGTTPKVQYAYSEMSGGANHSRPITITYPNGRVLNFNYTAGLDSTISRLSSITDSGTTLEAYTYLGLGIVVTRAHPQPGVDLTYIKQSGEPNGDAGDQYTGLDRFGRVFDQRWIVTSNQTHTDRLQYGFDRNGNRLYRQNMVQANFSEVYRTPTQAYDNLNQLTNFARGTLNAANDDVTEIPAARRQSWSFDAMGNWTTLTSDGSAQARTHNQQNQITAISGQTTPLFDANGNMITDQTGKSLIFDPWNRLVEVKSSGGATLVSYAYDALNRRIRENPGTLKDLYFSNDWQVLEEREASLVRSQNVWSPVYVDALIVRDRDADGNGSLEERLYVQLDARVNASKSTIMIASPLIWASEQTYDSLGFRPLSGESHGRSFSRGFHQEMFCAP